MSTGEVAVELLARLYPWDVTASRSLDRALGYLGASVDSETVVRAGYGAAVACAPIVAAAVALAPAAVAPLVGVVGLCLLAGIVHAVHTGPQLLATARRARALGDAPALVGRLVLWLRVEPTAEAAAAFAAESGEGPLADSLDDHVRRAADGPGSGLESFATEWRAWFPALGQASTLVRMAASDPPEDRERTLDRGMQTVLDGTREQMATFAAELRGPSTALYAFGVLLPLALVSLIPAARAAGITVPLSAIVLVYDVVLPGALVGASAWILVTRPAAFPPPNIGRSHPDVPDRRWPPLLAGLAVGGSGWVVGATLIAPWAGPMAGFGAGIGIALLLWYRPMTVVRERVCAVESGLADALYHVGRRVAEGTAVERAIADAADDIPGATGDVVAAAAGRQRRLGVGVREAFLGRHGALADVPSSRARSAAALFGLAADVGRPAGDALVAMAENIEELSSVEREARAQVASVTRTLANTAAVFGPLVAGATVALAGRMPVGEQLGTAGGVSTAGLGVAVGAYVLLLAAILTALSTALTRGLDRALVGYRVGWALLAATATYLATFVGVGLLV